MMEKLRFVLEIVLLKYGKMIKKYKIIILYYKIFKNNIKRF